MDEQEFARWQKQTLERIAELKQSLNQNENQLQKNYEDLIRMRISALMAEKRRNRTHDFNDISAVSACSQP